MTTIHVVLADRDDLVVAGLRMVLEPADDIAVVGLAGTGDALLDEVRAQRPDVAVVDAALPVLGGVAAIRCLHTLHPACATVLLTAHGHERAMIDAIQAGARGVLPKAWAHTDLAAAVRSMAQCEPLVHTALLAPLLEVVCQVPPPMAPPAVPMILSAREREVLQLVAAGLANTSIAQLLDITVATVKRHLSTIFTKLAVTNRAHAVALAREHIV